MSRLGGALGSKKAALASKATGLTKPGSEAQQPLINAGLRHETEVAAPTLDIGVGIHDVTVPPLPSSSVRSPDFRWRKQPEREVEAAWR